MSKKKNIAMTKLYCLSQLLIENLDELKATTPSVVKFKADLTAFCEELNNITADTYTVQKSTYFSQIAHKIDTILRHEFKDNQ